MKGYNILLKCLGYSDPRKYWETRWRHETPSKGLLIIKEDIFKIIENHYCFSVLDVGCGPAHLRDLPGYLGLDFSLEILLTNNLESFVYCDFSKGLPFPDKSFDAVLCANVLLHIKPKDIESVVENVCRVTKKVVVIVNPLSFIEKQVHCFSHDLKGLFKKYGSELETKFL